MLKSELLETIANGENSGIEFKRDNIRPEQLAKEIVALANVQGGRILLGVEDDGHITGLQRENPQEWVLNVFRDKVHPQIIPFYEEIAVEPDLRVGIITLSAGISKPYVRRHNNREETFIRLGDRSEPATREQQARLFQSGGLLHVETMPVAGTTFADLDLDRLNTYLDKILADPDVPTRDADWIDRLLALGLMTGDGLGNRVCTIAGLLLFGINPRRFLRQAGLRLMVFDGTDKSYRARLDVHLDGPLVARWRQDGSGRKQLVDDGLIERFIVTVLPFITEETDRIDENLRREKQWHYPKEAIRETVVNALAHRDWTRSVEIEVTLYSDRLEVISPGKLPNSMSITKMKAGQRSPRNQLIMDTLKDCGYVESRGMGVRTKIIPLMRRQNGREPVFEATEDCLKTILPRKHRSSNGGAM